MQTRTIPHQESDRYRALLLTLLGSERASLPPDMHPRYVTAMFDATLTAQDIVKRVQRVLNAYVVALKDPMVMPATAPPEIYDWNPQVATVDNVRGYGQLRLITKYSQRLSGWVNVEQLVWTGKLVCSMLIDYSRLVQDPAWQQPDAQQTLDMYGMYWLEIAAAAGAD